MGLICRIQRMDLVDGRAGLLAMTENEITGAGSHSQHPVWPGLQVVDSSTDQAARLGVLNAVAAPSGIAEVVGGEPVAG